MTERRGPIDPLEILRSPVTPLAPDPAFSARLRARLSAALQPDDPGDAHMSKTETTYTSAAAGIAAAPIGVTPYLIVPEGDEAIAWYESTLDAQVVGDPIVMDDGRIGHAELLVNGGMLYLASAFPEEGFEAPKEGAPATVSLHLTVPDVDRVAARAGGAGAEIERAPYDSPYGRGAAFRDPFGHRWLLHQSAPSTPERPPVNGEGHGDVSYLTMMVPDSAAARAFYGSVLGWTFSPGRVDDGWQVEGVQPMTGMWGAGPEVEVPTMVPMYRVDDIAAAVERVRAAGGTATDPTQEPYGLSAECVDDQGARFYLGQH